MKFNIKIIEQNPDFKKNKSSKQNHIKKRNNFIYNNLNTIFTVEYDEKYSKNTEYPQLICLKEDTNNPKWLFWIGDFIKYK